MTFTIFFFKNGHSILLPTWDLILLKKHIFSILVWYKITCQFYYFSLKFFPNRISVISSFSTALTFSIKEEKKKIANILLYSVQSWMVPWLTIWPLVIFRKRKFCKTRLLTAIKALVKEKTIQYRFKHAEIIITSCFTQVTDYGT